MTMKVGTLAELLREHSSQVGQQLVIILWPNTKGNEKKEMCFRQKITTLCLFWCNVIIVEWNTYTNQVFVPPNRWRLKLYRSWSSACNPNAVPDIPTYSMGVAMPPALNCDPNSVFRNEQSFFLCLHENKNQLELIIELFYKKRF